MGKTKENKKAEWKVIPMTEEEKEKAKADQFRNKLEIERLELQKKQLDDEIKSGHYEKEAVRSANEQIKNFLKNTETQLETAKLNKQAYDKQVETGKREVMVDGSEDDETSE